VQFSRWLVSFIPSNVDEDSKHNVDSKDGSNGGVEIAVATGHT